MSAARKAGRWILELFRRLRFKCARRRYERASAALAASGAVGENMLTDDEAVIVFPDTIPCICCGRPLQDWSAGNNQPIRGLEFAAGGQYAARKAEK